MKASTLFINFIAAFAGSYSFAILFNSPRKQRSTGGLTGAVGWVAYLAFLNYGLSRLSATFAAAVVVAIISETAGRLRKAPVTIFLLPGIIPLVPGADAYLAMLAFSRGDWASGIDITVKTLFLAAAIAGGSILTGSITRMRKNHRA